MKKGQKQLKKIFFKINAKIEDVGLNMKIKKVRKQEMVTKFHDQQKILHTASLFLSELTVSKTIALLNILQFTFTIILLLWLTSHFTKNLEKIRTHIPYFYFAFSFSVIWSSPVEQLIKSEVLMTTTYHLLQWLSLYTSRVFGKISFSFSAKPKRFQ